MHVASLVAPRCLPSHLGKFDVAEAVEDWFYSHEQLVTPPDTILSLYKYIYIYILEVVNNISFKKSCKYHFRDVFNKGCEVQLIHSPAHEPWNPSGNLPNSPAEGTDGCVNHILSAKKTRQEVGATNISDNHRLIEETTHEKWIGNFEAPFSQFRFSFLRIGRFGGL